MASIELKLMILSRTLQGYIKLLALPTAKCMLEALRIFVADGNSTGTRFGPDAIITDTCKALGTNMAKANSSVPYWN